MGVLFAVGILCSLSVPAAAGTGTVAVSDTGAPPTGTATLTVTVDNMPDGGLQALQGTVGYDASIVIASRTDGLPDCAAKQGLDELSSFSVDNNAGELSFGVARSSGGVSSGTVIECTLEAVGESGDTSPLDLAISAAQDADGTSFSPDTENGQFRINTPPTCDDRSMETARNKDLSFDLTSSCTDPDGDPLSFTITDSPDQGTLSGSPSLLTYTPREGFTGFDRFAFRADDGVGGSDTGTALLSVGGAVFALERGTGDVWAFGTFQAGGADLAERITVSEPVEPGDVVAVDPQTSERYRRTREAHSSLATGVIASDPGVVLGADATTSPFPLFDLSLSTWIRPTVTINSGVNFSLTGLVPRLDAMPLSTQPVLALMGQVPVKATTANGPIQPGDLLVSASKPGYAMRCAAPNTCEGAIIGKAMEALDEGTGRIRMLVVR